MTKGKDTDWRDSRSRDWSVQDFRYLLGLKLNSEPWLVSFSILFSMENNQKSRSRYDFKIKSCWIQKSCLGLRLESTIWFHKISWEILNKNNRQKMVLRKKCYFSSRKGKNSKSKLYEKIILFLSNSTPTCKPNSTSVGWRRSWLCFPTEEEGRKKEGTHT